LVVSSLRAEARAEGRCQGGERRVRLAELTRDRFARRCPQGLKRALQEPCVQALCEQLERQASATNSSPGVRLVAPPLEPGYAAGAEACSGSLARPCWASEQLVDQPRRLARGQPSPGHHVAHPVLVATRQPDRLLYWPWSRPVRTFVHISIERRSPSANHRHTQLLFLPNWEPHDLPLGELVLPAQPRGGVTLEQLRLRPRMACSCMPGSAGKRLDLVSHTTRQKFFPRWPFLFVQRGGRGHSRGPPRQARGPPMRIPEEFSRAKYEILGSLPLPSSRVTAQTTGVQQPLSKFSATP
jgi:hypothetical protein